MTWTLNKGGRSVDTEYGRVRVEANASADVPELMARIAKLPDLEREVERLRGERDALAADVTHVLSETHRALAAKHAKLQTIEAAESALREQFARVVAERDAAVARDVAAGAEIHRLRARVGRRECEHGIHLLSTCSVCEARSAP